MSKDFIKLPRLYVEASLADGQAVPLRADQGHYLRNVLRRAVGDSVRLFNGRDGEWLATIDVLDKKNCTVIPSKCVKSQPTLKCRIALYFAPIKKARMDWLIEKAVELGATDLHPVLTQFTELRVLNEDRLTAQIIEAAEQCERLDVPRLHGMIKLQEISAPVLACLERDGDCPSLQEILTPSQGGRTKEGGTEIIPTLSVLIGPEGGFSQDESAWLKKSPHVTCVSLGDTILRAETASIYALSCLRMV
jgi:16S rRNA (uracil1498-N3)-methyltransferase